MGQQTPPTGGPDHPYPPPRVAWFAVGILMLAYIFSFIDRFVLSLLVEPLKTDLQLTDVQISLLQGFSFALFYTLAAFPIGRLADSRSRMAIITVGIAFWSLATAVSGLATRYWQLLLARMGVGVGEATLVPAAYSLIADYFRREQLGFAMAVFSLGASIGAGLAFMLGGYVVQWISAAGPQTIAGLPLKPWQLTFICVGLPGLLVAALLATRSDPPRRAAATELLPLGNVIAYLRRNAFSISMLLLGQGISAMAAYGILSWTPTLLIRVHKWSVSDAGAAVGGGVLIAGTLGVLAGGWISDRLVSRGQVAARFSLSAASMVLAVLASALFPLQRNGVVLLTFFALTIFSCYMTIGTMAAALQEMVPNRMRGQASALYLFATSLLGMGAGPTVIALLTDRVFMDPAALGYSIAVASPLALAVAGVCFYAGRRAFAVSVAQAREWELAA